MVLRETTFQVGGGLTIALGLVLGIGLFLAGAGLLWFEAWLGAGLAVGLGAFFVYVGRTEAQDRRRGLQTGEATPSDPPRAQPPGPRH